VFAWLSALFSAIAFILFAAKASTNVPWTPTGFVILALVCLALHAAWAWYPWRHP
jgi:NhaP-type Na+/H+ or K+/H+ antiporter